MLHTARTSSASSTKPEPVTSSLGDNGTDAANVPGSSARRRRRGGSRVCVLGGCSGGARDWREVAVGSAAAGTKPTQAPQQDSCREHRGIIYWPSVWKHNTMMYARALELPCIRSASLQSFAQPVLLSSGGTIYFWNFINEWTKIASSRPPSKKDWSNLQETS
jgi:hypothetical protein